MTRSPDANSTTKKQRKLDRRRSRASNPDGSTRLLAPWQRAVLWIIWFGTFAVIWANTDRESLGFVEFLTLIAAIGVTVWTCKHPRGKPKVVIDDPNAMLGEFASRPNWPWILVSAFITLGGVAFAVRLVGDLHSGRSTVKDVIVDVEIFFTEWLKERLSGGTAGDVTNAPRLYVMVILLPLGGVMLLLNALPLLFRGRAFRVAADGSLHIRQSGVWTRLNPADYATITADGFTIDFRPAAAADNNARTPAVSLPQSRVFSREHDTRVEPHVIALMLRRRAEAAGFAIDSRSANPDRETMWIATRVK